MLNNYLSIDIGGTFTKFAVISKDGKIMDSGKVDTPRNEPNLYELINELLVKNKFSVSGVAISCPGKVNNDTGEILYGGSVPYLHNIPLKKYIEKKYQLPCYILNDGKAAALAELWLGNLKNIRNGVAIVLGTGVGGGVIINKQLVNGSHFQAGELSFMLNSATINGEYSLIGTTLSSVSFVEEACNLLKHENFNDGKFVFDELERKNQKILSLFEIYCYNVAVLIVNLQAVLDIEKVVIGGGISSQPLLIDEVRNQYSKIRKSIPLMKMTLSEIEIDPCYFTNKANLLGAVYKLMSEDNDG